LVGFAKVTRDFTERRRQRDEMLRLERALREERDTLRAASESAVDAFFICEALRDADGEVEDFVFIDVNGKAEALMSTPRARFIGGRMSELFAELNERKNLLQQCKTVVSTGDPMNHEFPMGAEGPLSAWMRAQAVKLRDGVAITISDISERKRSEAHMIHAAHHDHLTGLPNRNLLTDRLEQAIERSRRDGSKAAVLAIDLDGFKQVNDTFGHATGDGVLITAAARLKMSVRATDTVARIGGDEFVVIMPEIREFANVLQCAEKIVRALREGVEVQGHAVRISCSVGISVYPDSATSARDLLTQSDAAMYLAKQNGKNQLALCTNEALASGLPENILWARPAIPTAACVGHRLLGAEFLQQIPSELADFPQGLPIGMLAGANRRGTDISKSAFARAKSRRPVD
jgi:diguanylate cyclase (GGDEF)-like protein